MFLLDNHYQILPNTVFFVKMRYKFLELYLLNSIHLDFAFMDYLLFFIRLFFRSSHVITLT